MELKELLELFQNKNDKVVIKEQKPDTKKISVVMAKASISQHLSNLKSEILSREVLSMDFSALAGNEIVLK